jgi:hypothetical protein
MSVGSSTSACRIKRRARTTLRPASLSPRPKIFRTTCAETRDCGCIRGYARKSRRRKCPSKRDTDVGKKSSPGKDRKKRRRLDERFPVSSRFSETASRTRRERRNTRPLTWHTKRRQAEHLAAFRETEERRCRDSLLFAKSKKKSAVVDERARDLRSTPHRSARASGGDARVDPTTRARAPRVAAKAGTGWPSTRGRASRDTILGRADACLRVFF